MDTRKIAELDARREKYLRFLRAKFPGCTAHALSNRKLLLGDNLNNHMAVAVEDAMWRLEVMIPKYLASRRYCEAGRDELHLVRGMILGCGAGTREDIDDPSSS